jgi:hypothetical protein
VNASSPPAASPPGAAGTAIPPSVLESIEQHLDNYEKLTAAGKLAQAGQELEAIRQETRNALGKSGTGKPAAGSAKPLRPKERRKPK